MRRCILKDNHRVADDDFGMRHGPVWSGEAHALGGAEDVGVEREGLGPTVDDQRRCHSSISIGNGIGLAVVCHGAAVSFVRARVGREVPLLLKTIGDGLYTTLVERKTERTKPRAANRQDLSVSDAQIAGLDCA
jgi:hypothetical protein